MLYSAEHVLSSADSMSSDKLKSFVLFAPSLGDFSILPAPNASHPVEKMWHPAPTMCHV